MPCYYIIYFVVTISMLSCWLGKENMMSHLKEPKGRLLIRTLAMPADTNPHGDIFGGWLVSQMDLAEV